MENVFGILAARFRIFHTEINMKPGNIEKVVLACCALHNFLRRNTNRYSPPECLDNEDLECGEIVPGLRAQPGVFVDLQRGQNRNATTTARKCVIILWIIFVMRGEYLGKTSLYKIELFR